MNVQREPSIYTTIGTVYTLGYAAQEAAAALDRLMHQDRILLLDIRYRPCSRWWPSWNKNALAARFGPRYRWEQALGNVHYRQRELGIQLADGHEQAIMRAAGLLCEGTSLVLLCACKDARTCHRSLVAKLLQDAVQTLQEGVHP